MSTWTRCDDCGADHNMMVKHVCDRDELLDRARARVAELEAANSDLRNDNEHFRKQAMEYALTANALRDALTDMLPGLSFSQQCHIRSLLDDAPAASLASHDAEVIERVAAVEHDQWCQWAISLMDTEPGLSHARVSRWRSLLVPYAELSEEMKEHDRKWARLAIRALAAQDANAGEVKP